jgi:hypothetical protein
VTLVYVDGVTEEKSACPLLDLGHWLKSGYRGKSRYLPSMETFRADEIGSLRGSEICAKSLSRKASKITYTETVPQTDTGDQVE